MAPYLCTSGVSCNTSVASAPAAARVRRVGPDEGGHVEVDERVGVHHEHALARRRRQRLDEAAQAAARAEHVGLVRERQRDAAPRRAQRRRQLGVQPVRVDAHARRYRRPRGGAACTR